MSTRRRGLTRNGQRDAGKPAGSSKAPRTSPGIEERDESLRESLELSGAVTDGMQDGMIVVDREGGILFANKAAYRIAGLRVRKKPGGLNLSRVIHPDDLQRAMEDHMQAKEGTGGLLSRYRLVTPRGGDRWIEATGQKVSFCGKEANLVTFRDITGRKDDEDALRISEERYRHITDAVTDYIYTVYLHEGDVVRTVHSPACEAITGYTMEDFSEDRYLWYTMVEEDDRDLVREHFSRVTTGEKVKPIEHRIRRKDGSVRWISNMPVLHRDASGAIMSYDGVVSDITWRKLAEQELKESEERFRALHDASFGGIGIHDEGIILDSNQGLSEITGYSIQELIGMNGLELIAPAWRDFVMQKILSGYDKPYEAEGVRRDGTIYPLQIHGKNIPYHGRTVRVTEFRDITERRQVEEVLRERQARLDSIFRAAPTGIGVVAHRILLEVNERICEMTGYSREELIGRSARILYPTQEDYEFVGSEKYRQIQQRGTGTVETRWKTKDGTVFDIILSSTPIDPDDDTAGVTFTALDITERKRAEEALREGEARYRLMAELTGKLVYDYDVPSGRITWHGAVSQLTGFLPEEFGEVDVKAWNAMIHPEDRSGTIVTLEAALQECGPYQAEYRLRRKDGSYIHAEDHGVFLPDASGNAYRMLGTVGDITERKRAEEALKQSEERFRSLFQNSADIIVILDVNGLVSYDTPSFSRVLGYPHGYLLGRTPLDLIHPDDVEKVARDLGDVYQNRNDGTPTEFRFRKADGTWIFLEAIGNNLQDYPGINGVVITARDITERKKAEDLRFEMERRLLHAQRLESLGVMAGGIAHDFNNLLMAILGNLDLAQLDLTPVSRSRPFIDHAMVAARRAADLTNQMLAYSGKGRFDLKTFDLSELVEEMSHLLKASISKTVTLNLQTARDLPSIKADPGQIQQIIMNLIVNGSEAIGDAPGVVTITTDSLECMEDCLKQSLLKEKPETGTYVLLEVKDTGCGMDKETMDRLFDPFFTTKFTGRGLGLAAVSGIIKGHKGAIMVDSEPGRGTAIKVLLPVSGDPPVKTLREPSNTKAKDSGGKTEPVPAGTVLVVDDEEMVRDLCRSMVERLGYAVITASDGEEAVRIFRDNAAEIVCVILDLTMPRKDGLDTFDELKHMNEGVRVILSSGFNEQETTHRFLGKGLAGFIKKPYRLESLRMELERVLGDS